MKTGAKVLIIISLVGAIISALFLVISAIATFAGATYLTAIIKEAAGPELEEAFTEAGIGLDFIGVVYGVTFLISGISCVIPVFVNIFALTRLNTATQKGALTVPAVLEIIFGGGTLALIAGILMLVLKDSDLAAPKVETQQEVAE